MHQTRRNASIASTIQRGQGRIKVCRAEGDLKPALIRGYGVVYYDPNDQGTEYWLWDDMVERVMPGAFDALLASTPDIRCLFNHDANHILGRTIANTCRLRSDEVGLYYEADENTKDSNWAAIASRIERGDISGSSYSFWPKTTVWEQTEIDGKTVDIRWIKEVGFMWDLGPVTFPAFTSTTSSRAIDGSELDRLRSERDSQLPIFDEAWEMQSQLMRTYEV